MAKYRSNFVANSSSSSFIVAYKGKKSDILKNSEEIFGVKKDSPLYSVSKRIINILFDGNEIKTQKQFKEYLEEYGYDEDGRPDILEYIKNGYTIINGSVCNDSGDSIESMVCDIKINYESENLIIKKEEGY